MTKTKYNKLSIIIPVYNEERTVEDIVSKVLRVKLPLQKEIILINDGSKDKSLEIMRRIKKANKNIILIDKKNGGKGSAIKIGLKTASGDIFVIQDADLEYEPKDFSSLLNPILEENRQVVYGSRYMSEKGHLKEHNHFTFKIHKLGNNFLSFLTSIFYFQKLTDMETCYKMFTRKVYEKIHLVSNNFNIEPEITAKIIKAGFKIYEVPIHYYSRDFNEGKKITWKDGIKAALLLVWLRFEK